MEGNDIYVTPIKTDVASEAQSKLQLPMVDGKYTNDARARLEFDTLDTFSSGRLKAIPEEPICSANTKKGWGSGGWPQYKVDGPINDVKVSDI